RPRSTLFPYTTLFRSLVERVAGREFPGPLGQLLDDGVVDGFLDQQPRARGTHLPLAVEDPALGAAHGGREVGIGEDDVGALAARSEEHTSELQSRSDL